MRRDDNPFMLLFIKLFFIVCVLLMTGGSAFGEEMKIEGEFDLSINRTIHLEIVQDPLFIMEYPGIPPDSVDSWTALYHDFTPEQYLFSSGDTISCVVQFVEREPGFIGHWGYDVFYIMPEQNPWNYRAYTGPVDWGDLPPNRPGFSYISWYGVLTDGYPHWVYSEVYDWAGERYDGSPPPTGFSDGSLKYRHGVPLAGRPEEFSFSGDDGTQ